MSISNSCNFCLDDFTGEKPSVLIHPKSGENEEEHLSCRPCLSQWFQSQQILQFAHNRNHNQQTTCPFCRIQILNPIEGVEMGNPLENLNSPEVLARVIRSVNEIFEAPAEIAEPAIVNEEQLKIRQFYEDAFYDRIRDPNQLSDFIQEVLKGAIQIAAESGSTNSLMTLLMRSDLHGGLSTDELKELLSRIGEKPESHICLTFLLMDADLEDETIRSYAALIAVHQKDEGRLKELLSKGPLSASLLGKAILHCLEKEERLLLNILLNPPGREPANREFNGIPFIAAMD